METVSIRRKKANTIWYRLSRYPRTTALSLGLVMILATIFCYFLGLLYPQFRLFDKLSSRFGIHHSKNYTFYTGRPGGAYYAIGNAINGPLADGDSVKNYPTFGGSANAMKLTIEKNSFGLIQEEIINHDDQLRKNVRIVSPLFLERMHIFYRKDLFKKTGRQIQLSASSDGCILDCFSDSAININMGPVGSGTRTIASYMMALIEQQINTRLKKTPNFIQLNESFSTSFKKINAYKEKTDSSVDILFYLNADPTDSIKKILDAGKYKLMSIDPSFVILLNKEFGLGLRIADFKGKYKSTKNVSTLATLTYLIASKTIRDDDVLKLLKKIDASRDSIYRSLIHDPQESNSADMFEFGFFNVFNDEYETSMNQRMKEVIIFLFSVLTLFFPVFKSVIGLKFIWQRWNINKRIDEIVADYENSPEGNDVARSGIKCLKEEVINLYGDGLLSETHYNPLMKRIGLYCEKISAKTKTAVKESAVNTNKGLNSVQFFTNGS